MPTIVTKTVLNAGADYTSLTAFEAGEQRDLVTLDEIARASCGNFSDGTSTNFAGWVNTDATRYIHVIADTPHGQGGTQNASAYRYKATMTVQEFVVLDRIQYKSSSACLNPILAGLTTVARGCTFKSDGALSVPVIISAGNLHLINCTLVTHGASYALDVSGGDDMVCNVYNCDLIGSAQGINIDTFGGTVNAKNSYAAALNGPGTAWNPPLTGTLNLTNCASNDASGSVGLRNIAYSIDNFKNVTEGLQDLRHATRHGPLVDAGVDTSGEAAPLNFTDDIAGNPRPQGVAWDIGISEWSLERGLPFNKSSRYFKRRYRGYRSVL